jgi:hypothetical protein
LEVVRIYFHQPLAELCQDFRLFAGCAVNLPTVAGCLGLTGTANKLHFGGGMRPYLVLSAPVLISAAAFGQSPAPYSGLCFYGCEPYIPSDWGQ